MVEDAWAAKSPLEAKFVSHELIVLVLPALGRVSRTLECFVEPSAHTRRMILRRKFDIQLSARVGLVIGAPDVDEFKIVEVFRNRFMRVTFIAEDGRRFSKGSTTPSVFRKDDLVRLEKGFMGSKVLVRSDGLRIKVKEISAN